MHFLYDQRSDCWINVQNYCPAERDVNSKFLKTPFSSTPKKEDGAG
jgi:hypothetical protein